jgi:leucyl-tRNA synthetase
VVVQVNGKIRDRLQVAPGVAEDELVALAQASEKVQAFLNGGDAARVVVVQVNGKLRDRIEVGADAPREDVLAAARESEKVRRHLDGMEVVKEVVVPGKLVNLVVR